MAEPRVPVPPASGTLLWITGHIVAYKGASAVAAAGIALVTARRLGPDGRGGLVLVLTLASVILLFPSLGLNASGRINLVGSRPVALSDFMGLSTVLTFVQVTLCAALGLLLLPSVGVRLSALDDVLFALLGGSLLAPYFLNGALNAYGFTRVAAAVDAAGSVAQLVFVVLLAAASVTNVSLYVVALTVGNGLQLLLSLFVLQRLGFDLRPRVSRPEWRRLIRTGLPAMPSDFGLSLAFRLDRYLLGLLLNPAAVGVYSVAATAPELLRLPSLALAQPMFYRVASGAARVRDFRRTRLMCLAANGVMAIVTFAIAPTAVHVLFGAKYAGAVTPLRVLLLAEFGMTLFYLDGSSLAAGSARVHEFSTAAVMGFVVVGAGDLILIPAYGVSGAAWASVIGYSVMGLAAHLLLRRRTRAGVIT